MFDAPQPRRQGDEEVPASLPRRFLRPRLVIPAILVIGMAVFLTPSRELGSDNFIFYFPGAHRLIPFESSGADKYLPALQVLNAVGKVDGVDRHRSPFPLTPLRRVSRLGDRRFWCR